jgi:hypothetical protein
MPKRKLPSLFVKAHAIAKKEHKKNPNISYIKQYTAAINKLKKK